MQSHIQTALETTDSRSCSVMDIFAQGKDQVYSNCLLHLPGGEDAQRVFEGGPLQSPADIIL